jgi:hypothetical protein
MCDSAGNDHVCWPQIAQDSDFPEDIKNNCPLVPVSLTKNLVKLIKTIFAYFHRKIIQSMVFFAI